MKSVKMKSLMTAAVLGLSSLAALPSVKAEAESVVSVVKIVATAVDYDLALRFNPSWAYGTNVKATVKKGETVTVLKSGEVFSYVAYKDMTGYLPTMYLEETAKVYVSTPIGTYMTAEDAKNGKNAVGYYPSGTYYLYKTADGMMNISVSADEPGRWVNPNVAAIPDPEMVTLEKDYLTYISSYDAKDEVNALPGYYAAGNYFVFNEYMGMLNVTKTKGVPGRWINPDAVKFPEKVKTFTLKNAMYTYMTAEDAKNEENALAGSYAAGTYFIYKDAGKGIMNLSKVAGQPGRWINTASSSTVLNKVSLTKDTYTYINAEDAENEVNALSTIYKAGTYFVYRYYNGMYNISSVEGEPGRWINPNPKKVPGEVKTYTLESENYTYINAEDAAAEKNMLEGTYGPGKYYIYKTSDNGMINITTVAGEAGRWINPSATKFPGKVATVNLATSYVTFMTAEDAENLVNPLDTTYAAGTYYIYKGTGNILNVSKSPDEAGRWINYEYSSIPKPEAPMVTVGVTKRFKTAEDASSGKNSVGTYPAGKYYIYKDLGNGIMNISTEEGVPGSWVNLK